MSVIRAILFYSKHDRKSMQLKNLVDQLNTDIDTVSVDAKKIRRALLHDDTYNIKQVPALLLLYATGQHKIYTSTLLDQWFEQLLQNITAQQQQIAQPQYTPIETPVQEDNYTVIGENTPKPLRRRAADTQDIPTNLRPPGRPKRETGIAGSGMSGTGPVSSAQAAMISEHIRDSEPTVEISSEPQMQASRKEVKKDGLSAAELAKQMAEAREQYDEKVEENRPFL